MLVLQEINQNLAHYLHMKRTQLRLMMFNDLRSKETINICNKM